MVMPERKFTATSSYRYGFNGKENDNEVKGEGNLQDYGMRIYDPRLGRFLSEDPLTAQYSYLTPYQFASNRPIDGIDLDGKEWAQETVFKNIDCALVVERQMTLKVKVLNNSTIVTDPNVIRAKAELFKKSMEKKYTEDVVLNLFGMKFIVRYKTDVILDFTPPSPDDLPSIGILSFDDRQSVKTVSTITNGNTITTNTNSDKTPGETKGRVNGFKISVGITMDGTLVDDSELEKTFDHEGGHSGGLRHPWALSEIEKRVVPELDQLGNPKALISTVKENLLNSTENPDPAYNGNSGSRLLPGQRRAMFEIIKKDALYKPAELKSNDKPNN